MSYDIIIIGGGPAGICAAIYALRANKTVLVLEKEIVGGKVATTPLIENYPGIKQIKGNELSEHLSAQVVQLGGEIKFEKAIEIQDNGSNKNVMTQENTYQCKAIILATGTKYKKLGLEGEEELIGKGVSFCAVCDGFFYKDKKVAVIGGGNTAIANALELSRVCQKVYIIQMTEKLTGEAILIQQLEQKQNVECFLHTTVSKLLGTNKITGIEIKQEERVQTLQIDGVFIAIGQIPETDFIKEKIQTNDKDYININSEGMTNIEGIFAAGDCVNKKIKQLTTAVSDGTIAALNAIEYIDKIL